ncbi:MAG: hypothetical protein ACR2PF_03300 [Rhizobiaceae bacterium]
MLWKQPFCMFRLPFGERCRSSSHGLHELQAIADCIVSEVTFEIRSAAFPVHLVAGFFKFSDETMHVLDQKGGMSFPCGTEIVLDAEMDL